MKDAVPHCSWPENSKQSEECSWWVFRSELFPYETSIFYTVLMAVVTLERPELKEKVVGAPEILIVIDSVPNLNPFLTSLYACKYADFFKVRD